MKEKLLARIKQAISQWEEKDIYAISLYVSDEEDDPFRPTVTLGYNTDAQVKESLRDASDEQEARWNYAFWLQNEAFCWGKGETAEETARWLSEQDLMEEEVTEEFVELLIDTVRELHGLGLLTEKFGRELPVLIHELEYYDEIAEQNIRANGEELAGEFAEFCLI